MRRVIAQASWAFEIVPMITEAITVIRGKNDNGIIQISLSSQQIKDFTDLAINHCLVSQVIGALAPAIRHTGVRTVYGGIRGEVHVQLAQCL